jgi:hypothetical protein
MEGTINTLQRRAQKITCETKLPKISKKLPSWRGKLEGTINTPSEGTNNYAHIKTSNNPQKIAELEGTINNPSEVTNSYVQTKTSKKRQYYVRNKTSQISKKKKRRVGGDNKYPTFFAIFLTLSSIQRWTLGEGVMILAYLG